MDNEEDSAMETDVSAEAISLSPDTSRISLNNSPHSSATKEKTLVKAMEISSGEENPGPRHDLEEGEIDSDARSSPEHSPEHDSDRLFPQLAHPNYLPDSPDLSEEMSTGSPSSFARRNIAVEKVEAKNTKEKETEFETNEVGDDYKTIPVESSSDEAGDHSGKEEVDEAPDTDVLSGSASSDFSDDEDMDTKRRHRDEPVASNLESMDGDSDSVRSSRSSIVDRGRQRDAEAVKSDSDAESEDESTRLSKDEKARSVYFNKSKNNQEKDMRSAKYNDDDSDSFSSKIQARSQQYSDEDSSGHFRTKVAKSQKYSDDSDDVIAKIAPKNKNHSDNDSDNDVIDHLEIAAPQQALIKGSKKKSSKDKSHKARSSSKDERQKKQKDKREEGKSREKERRERKDNHEKNYGKYKERKYEAYDKKTDRDSGRSRSPIDKKADRDSGRPRSPVEKKSHSMAEEDLRKKLLQKRSTRDDFVVKVERDQRDVREVYHKDEKNPRHDKIEKRRSEPHIRVKKEDSDSYPRGKKEDDARLKKTDSDTRGKKEEKASESSKKSKTVKEGRDERDKSYKKDKSPSKKRRREKTKSEVKKRKTGSDTESKKTRNVSDIDSSDDDDDDDEKRAKEARKSSSKKLRITEENTADADNKTIVNQVLENEAEDNKDYDYDDISPVSSEEMSPPVSPIELKKPTYYPAIMGCRDVKEFHWLNKIEEGTYGVVYRARDCRTEEIVALKRLKMEKEKEGFPITSLREINTLLKAQHPNIVTVREIVVGSNMDKIYIVMDYVEHDLKALMETMTQPFLVGEVKTLMIQLLRGVQHMHDNWILHRDIKASNLLLSHKGILKIGDFGLAREYGSPLKQYTTVVVTLWYRAPELLLGGKMYATAIDLWSCGCVFAELLTMKPLFPGKSEIDQINKIFKELGTPTDAIWPGPPSYSEYPMVKKTNFANHPYNILRQKFGATLTDKGFNLLNKLLTYDPSKRITAEEALKHEFFEESPLPVDPSMFPTWPAKSELAHRAVRKHNASPKAPEGGAAASKVANDDSSAGFHMPAATKGFSAKGAGFNLKF